MEKQLSWKSMIISDSEWRFIEIKFTRILKKVKRNWMDIRSFLNLRIWLRIIRSPSPQREKGELCRNRSTRVKRIKRQSFEISVWVVKTKAINIIALNKKSQARQANTWRTVHYTNFPTTSPAHTNTTSPHQNSTHQTTNPTNSFQTTTKNPSLNQTRLKKYRSILGKSQKYRILTKT